MLAHSSIGTVSQSGAGANSGSLKGRQTRVMWLISTSMATAVHVRLVARLLNQLVFKSLVITLSVVMLCVLCHSFAEMALTQRNNLSKTFRFDGAYEALCICVQIRASRREL